MDASIRSLETIRRQLTELHRAQANNLTDNYMIGLYNGLELALATIEGREPHYERTHQKYEPRPNLYDVRHPDDIAVLRFAMCMRDKMNAARAKGRGGWENTIEVSGVKLTRMMVDHLIKGDPVDVANFCMMLHQRGDRIFPLEQIQHLGDDFK